MFGVRRAFSPVVAGVERPGRSAVRVSTRYGTRWSSSPPGWNATTAPPRTSLPQRTSPRNTTIRPLSAFASVQQPVREVRAMPKLRDRQIQRPCAGVELALPIPVTGVGARQPRRGAQTDRTAVVDLVGTGGLGPVAPTREGRRASEYHRGASPHRRSGDRRGRWIWWTARIDELREQLDVESTVESGSQGPGGATENARLFRRRPARGPHR
jgi:hypothetical protein